jgi:hypothetical protein
MQTRHQIRNLVQIFQEKKNINIDFKGESNNLGGYTVFLKQIFFVALKMSYFNINLLSFFIIIYNQNEKVNKNLTVFSFYILYN